ncbi:MAG: FAD-dependent oxidoreductase [Rhodospirillales bacterium]|nr:FAD-dependent oxidoreductase [Rhodospirillales bacterium]
MITRAKPAKSEKGSHNVTVVGAGIIGVCTALYLLRDGHRVTLIDRQAPGEGASFGNGSVIPTESVIPVQTPGILRRVPAMLLDPQGPLSLRWSYLPRLAPWLLRFVAASTTQRVEEISRSLAALLDGVVEAYEPLLEMADAQDMLRRTGWVCVYESEKGFQAQAAMLELQRRRGVRFQVLTPAELRQLEPALAPIFPRAVFYPDVAYTVNNFRLVQLLAETFQRHGGRLLRAEARGFEIGDAGPRAVLSDLGRHETDAVVVAAGAWSKPLSAQLGSRPPLDTERGYHQHLPEPGVMPRLPVYSTERGIVCAPLEHGLRIAGTVELGGLKAPPNWKRAEVLLTHARRWLPGIAEQGASRWMGFRPSMPDSVPVISASPHYPNAYFAFGHGHCGHGLGAKTGRLIADMVAGRDPGLDMTPYRVDRF